MAKTTFEVKTLAFLATITETDHQENWLARDPSIQHGVVTKNCQKRFDVFLPKAHLLTSSKMYRISFCQRLR
jgi:hypothetical protein